MIVPTPGSAEEKEQFAMLQRRLPALFTRVFHDRHAAQTIVVVPSLSLDREELRKLEGSVHYEERLLCVLMLLRFPRANIVYVTSEPLAPAILDYYLHLLPGIPPAHAMPRLTLLACNDHSDQTLTGKILSSDALIDRIRAAVPDPISAHMTCFNVTAGERTLAVRLGIPVYGCDPELAHLGSKSGSREIFRLAGVPLPDGHEHLRDAHDIVFALGDSEQVSLGCTFPANPAYTADVHEYGARVANVLAQKGVLSRFAVDFMTVWRDGRWHTTALEINLQKGGTTHPFLMLEFLTEGHYDTATSVYHSLNGNPCYYHATDNLKQSSYAGLTPDQLLDIAVNNDLHFDAASESGVMFHLMGALEPFGKLGALCVGRSAADAERFYANTVAVLDRESARVRSPRVVQTHISYP